MVFLKVDDIIRRFNSESLALDLLFISLLLVIALIPVSYLGIFALGIYTCWIMLVVLTVSQKAKYVASVIHTLWSAVFASASTVVLVRFWLNNDVAVVKSPLLFSLTIFWLVELVFGFLFSPHKWLSFFDRLERSIGYSFRVGLVVFILLIWQLAIDQVSFGLLLLPFVLSGAFEGIVILLQWLNYIGKVSLTFNYRYALGKRMMGTFGNPIMTAEYLVGTFFLNLWLLQSEQLPVILRFSIFIPTYLLITLGLHFTHGRASYLSLSFGALSILAFAVSGWIEWWIFILAMLPVVFELFSKRGNWLLKRFETSLARSTEAKDKAAPSQAVVNTESRFAFWKATFREKRRTFLKPEGISGVSGFFARTQDESVLQHVGFLVLDRTHNWFLDFLIEGGAFYLATFLLVNLTALMGFLASKNALGFVALSSILISELFGFPFQGNYLLWGFLIGVSWSTVSMTLTSLALLASIVALGTLFLANVLSLLLNKKAYISMKLWNLARNFGGRTNTRLKTHFLQEMVDLCPWAPDLYLWYAEETSESFSGTVSKAENVVSELNILKNWMGFVERQSPGFPNFVASAAGFALSLKDVKTNVDVVELAELWIDKALSKYPSNVYCRRFKALILELKGELEEAYAVLKRLVEDLGKSKVRDFEKEDSIWQNFFDLALKLGKNEDAKRFLELYKTKFKVILDQFEILKRISQLFKTPVEWRVFFKSGRDPVVRSVGKELGKASKVVVEWLPKNREIEAERIQLLVSETSEISERRIKAFCEALEEKLPNLKKNFQRVLRQKDEDTI